MAITTTVLHISAINVINVQDHQIIMKRETELILLRRKGTEREETLRCEELSPGSSTLRPR